MAGPSSSEYPVVFEAGICFSNMVIAGNDYFVPKFSADRLGIAFAFTKDLFKSDAQILEIALTYDLNAYACISVVANFRNLDGSPDPKPSLYTGIGINKIWVSVSHIQKKSVILQNGISKDTDRI